MGFWTFHARRSVDLRICLDHQCVCNMSAFYDSCRSLLLVRHRDFLHPNLKFLLSLYAIVPALSSRPLSYILSPLEFPFLLPLFSLSSIFPNPATQAHHLFACLVANEVGLRGETELWVQWLCYLEPLFLFLFCLSVARVIVVLQYQHTPL